jgi:hypothetical protein
MPHPACDHNEPADSRWIGAQRTATQSMLKIHELAPEPLHHARLRRAERSDREPIRVPAASRVDLGWHADRSRACAPWENFSASTATGALARPAFRGQSAPPGRAVHPPRASQTIRQHNRRHQLPSLENAVRQRLRSPPRAKRGTPGAPGSRPGFSSNQQRQPRDCCLAERRAFPPSTWPRAFAPREARPGGAL